MKYFAKHLPVEGEIKDNQLVIDIINSDFRIELFTTYIKEGILYDDRGFVRKIENCRPAKLFLCSRDTYYVEPPIGRYIDSKVSGHSITATKVIGEISPEATWVKERDEFEENQVEEWQYTDKGWYLPVGLSSIKGFPTRFKIKGPCGYFH